MTDNPPDLQPEPPLVQSEAVSPWVVGSHHETAAGDGVGKVTCLQVL